MPRTPTSNANLALANLRLGNAGGDARVSDLEEAGSARLDQVKAILAAYGISDLSTLGRLDIGGNVVPLPGLVRPGSPGPAIFTTFQSAYAAGPVRAGVRALRPIGGSARLLSAEAFPPIQPVLPGRSGPARAARAPIGGAPLELAPSADHRHAELAAPGMAPLAAQPGLAGAQMVISLDAAYWAASWINIADGTTVVLKWPNTYLLMIAEKITAGANVTVTWERPAHSSAPKPGTPVKRPKQPKSTAIAKPPPGFAGAPGVDGGSAASGLNAGSVEFWTLELTGSPAFDVRGQDGAQGGAGGDGGDGGDGADGVSETYDWVGFCRTAHGFGGDGGRGGNAGAGGHGGSGGNGGQLAFYAPQSAIDSFLARAFVSIAGGSAGAGGIPGIPGSGGVGGAQGSHPKGCLPGNDPATGKPEVRPGGAPGVRGAASVQGAPGSGGSPGVFSVQRISEDEFRSALLKPTIATLTPAIAHVDDTVSVSGQNFTQTDVVAVDGVIAPTTVIADTAIAFKVPSVAGGAVTARVREANGTLSNSASMYVQARILGATPTGLVLPGSTVRLNGSGFAAGARVHVNDQEMSTVTVVDDHTIDFTIVRPVSGIVPDAAGELVAVQVVLPDGGPAASSNTIQVTLDTFRIVVLGDSVAWGQGLKTEDKFFSRVQQMVSAAHGDVGVYTTVLAHSGATIGAGDATVLPALNGEVPTSYPTTLQQASAFDVPDQVELVLITAGLNDVNIRTILNPFTGKASISSLITQHCQADSSMLLVDVATRFPKAQIVITGYYQMVSDQSELAGVEAMLIALGLLVGGVIGGVAIGVFGAAELSQIGTNCKQLLDESSMAYVAAVADAIAKVGGPTRIFFADPGFGPDNAAFAPQTFIYGINSDLSPQDDPSVSGPRATVCVAAGEARTGVEVCKRASIGHPNPRGAQMYANAIAALL